jgi:hypothetical protein
MLPPPPLPPFFGLMLLSRCDGTWPHTDCRGLLTERVCGGDFGWRVVSRSRDLDRARDREREDERARGLSLEDSDVVGVVTSMVLLEFPRLKELLRELDRFPTLPC